jgi:hypothetical protein
LLSYNASQITFGKPKKNALTASFTEMSMAYYF